VGRHDRGLVLRGCLQAMQAAMAAATWGISATHVARLVLSSDETASQTGCW
jgi:hypothetical protein